MKLTCEHCGAGIDTNKDKRCPSCGAPYGTNKQYKEYHKKNYDYDLRERDADIHSKELKNKVVEGVISTGKKIAVARMIFMVIFAAIFMFIVYMAINTFNKTKTEMNRVNNTDDKYIEDVTNKPSEKEKVTVSFNELAEGSTFEIKCDKISTYKYDVFEKNDFQNSDLVVYNFHIVFKNTKNAVNVISNMKLTYTDEKGNTDISAKKHMANVDESKNEIDLYVSDSLTHIGNIAFEIPKNVKDVKLLYGNVIIEINDFKNKM